VYNRFNRWSGLGIWQNILKTVAGEPGPPKQVALDSTLSKHTAPPVAERAASEQAIGVTRGGRNSKIHALADKFCRPRVIILTPGNVADSMVVACSASVASHALSRERATNPFSGRMRRIADAPVQPRRLLFPGAAASGDQAPHAPPADQ
jgi:hypothetical protein